MSIDPAPFTRFYSLGEGGVVFHEVASRLWVLNATAAPVWCLFDGIRTPAEIGAELSRRFGADPSRAARDAHEAVRFFRDEGLLAGGQPPEPSPAPILSPIPLPGPELLVGGSWAIEAGFAIPGQTLEFRCQDAGIGQFFRRALVHFERQGTAPSVTRLAVVRASGATLDVYLDGTRRWAGLRRGEVLPYLVASAFLRGLDGLSDRLLFHAAVVAGPSGAIVLAGPAGSGKTTVAAALAARGWRCYSDEVAVFDVQRRAVCPFPFPLGVKSESAQALEAYYPGISQGPYSLRSDGKRVHYLTLPQGWVPAEGEECAVRALIFPAFQENEETRLSEIEKADALQRLAQTGASGRDLRAADVEATVEVVDRNPCWELIYSDLETAIRVLDPLL